MLDLYNRYARYLQVRYGQRVYKLPVHLPVSCPNRREGAFGCTYCGANGAGFEHESGTFSVAQQLEHNKNRIGKRYKAKKFIAYFQSFTNTFMPLEEFRSVMHEAVLEDIVEIAVSTRPDCIRKEYLDVLQEIKAEKGIEITIELGLQTANYHSLINVNRGHTLAEYIEAAMWVKQYGFQLCTHLILNLPWDDELDVIESAKIVSVMKSDYVKLHALYIEKGTELARQYQEGSISLCTVEEYQERVILFLEYLSPDIAIQRILGRAPEENTLFANWGQSWWKIRDEIEVKMQERGSYQGKQFHYLGGKGVREFF
jgi:radical SAM protein (TIGR01212 family)